MLKNALTGWSRWEGPSSTTRPFDSDDVLFIEENPHGDFSSAAWGDTIPSTLVDLMSWLDTPFMSSPAQCYVLEAFYERCLTLVRIEYFDGCREFGPHSLPEISFLYFPIGPDDLSYLLLTLSPFLMFTSFQLQVADGDEWPTNCVLFQTIISDTVTGIECDATRIYNNAHPYPKKPGNIIATFIHTLVWEEASDIRSKTMSRKTINISV